MARKRIGTRKCIYLCIALLVYLSTASCASLDDSLDRSLLKKLWPQDEARRHLLQAGKLLAGGNYEAALNESEKALSLAVNGPPGDEALYNIGLIYACPGNPKKDQVKSIAALKRLIKEYPEDTWAKQGKVWVQVLQESENAKRVAVTVVQENDKLKRMIEETKKVDIEIDERKRERAGSSMPGS
jgi:tetratricopeptide (TPR) repeat protein